jgi:hypothetical protein
MGEGISPFRKISYSGSHGKTIRALFDIFIRIGRMGWISSFFKE